MTRTYFNIPVKKGEEALAVSKITELYNRHGFIGNSLDNVKVHIHPNEDLTLTFCSTGKVDDGRELDGIEERKGFGLFRVVDGDMTQVNAFAQEHEDDDLSRPFVAPIGQDILYFFAFSKRRTYNYVDPLDGDDDDRPVRPSDASCSVDDFDWDC